MKSNTAGNSARKKSYLSSSGRFTVILSFIYASIAVWYYFTYWPDTDYWVIRLVTGGIMFGTIVFTYYMNAVGKLSDRHAAWITPAIITLSQIIFAILVGGDNITFWILLSGSVLCLSFMDKEAMLITTGLSTALIFITMYGLGIPILGPKYSFIEKTMLFIAFTVVNILLLSISEFSIKRLKDNEAVGLLHYTFLETTPGYVAVVDDLSRVVSISRAMSDRLGVSRVKYALNRPIFDLCRYYELKLMFQETMEAGGYLEKTFEITDDNGKMLWLIMRSALIPGERGMRIFEISDITPIMEAKLEAELATKAKSDFLANMSHEIRTPMNAIVGMTELLMLKPLDSDQLFQAVSIKGASMSLLKIINDILDFSKIDSQKMEIINKPFDFSSLINDTINMIGIKTCAQGLTFLADISNEIPPIISGDELRIKQALINLLNNAMKFTKEGYISIGASAERINDGTVLLNFAIKDTGIGIKSEDIGKLFSEYEQFDPQKNQHITGTGLGLTITRKFIELMGGRINVESEYGKGSTFSFYIVCESGYDGNLAAVQNPERYKVLYYEPNQHHARLVGKLFSGLNVECVIVDNEYDLENRLGGRGYTHVFFDKTAEKTVERYTVRNEASFNLVKEINDVGSVAYPKNYINRPAFVVNIARILQGLEDEAGSLVKEDVKVGAFKTINVKALLVDDQPANLIVAEGLLRQYGISVSTATGGQEAIDMAQDGIYDLIFMDHMMPDIDGVQATKAIRELGGDCADMPIIALSANAVSGMKDLFLNSGMDDFLSKPIIIKELHQMLLKFIPHDKVLTTNTKH